MEALYVDPLGLLYKAQVLQENFLRGWGSGIPYERTWNWESI